MTDDDKPTAPARDGRMGAWVATGARVLRAARLIWLAPVLMVIALGSWGLASPVGSAPDDDFHLVSAWCAHESDATCLPGPTSDTRTVPGELLQAPCFAFAPAMSASCQDSLFDHHVRPDTVTDRGNFRGGYPPLYYSVMGVFAGGDVVASALEMRLVNILLFAALTSALYALLPARRRSALVWGWMVTLVPLGAFLIASNNPSGWALTGVGSAFMATLGYLETEGRRRVTLAALIFVATLIAAGSRGDAALYTIIGIGAALLLHAAPTRDYVRRASVPVAAGAVAAVFILTAGQVGAGLDGLQGGAQPGGAGLGTGLGLLVHNLFSVTFLWTGALGAWGLGWLDTAMPSIVPVAVTAAFVALGFTGLRLMNRRKAVVVLGLAGVLAAVPLYVLQRGGDAVGVDVQPRYLLPLIVLLAFALLIGPRGEEFLLTRTQFWAVALGLSVAHAVALATNIRRYVTGADAGGLNLNSGTEWWWDLPVSPMAVWALGSLAFAGLIVLLVRRPATAERAAAR